MDGWVRQFGLEQVNPNLSSRVLEERDNSVNVTGAHFVLETVLLESHMRAVIARDRAEMLYLKTTVVLICYYNRF